MIVKNCITNVKRVTFFIEDKDRLGKPVSVCTPANIDAVHDSVLSDRLIGLKQMSEALKSLQLMGNFKLRHCLTSTHLVQRLASIFLLGSDSLNGCKNIHLRHFICFAETNRTPSFAVFPTLTHPYSQERCPGEIFFLLQIRALATFDIQMVKKVEAISPCDYFPFFQVIT